MRQDSTNGMLCRGNVMKNAIKNVIKKRSVGFGLILGLILGLVLSLVFDCFLFDFCLILVLLLFWIYSGFYFPIVQLLLSQQVTPLLSDMLEALKTGSSIPSSF